MELIRRWLVLRGTSEPAADALLERLRPLPGRPVYPGPHADPTLASFEWSVRRAHGGATDASRFAYSVDPDRAPAGGVAHFLAARAPLAPPIATLVAALARVHVQVGVAEARAKLYVYARGAPRGTVERTLDVAGVDLALRDRLEVLARRPTAFVALDLDPTGVAAAKLYFEHDTADSARATLAALGRERLADRAGGVDPGLGSAPARLVVSVRAAGAEIRDVTLHVKIDRADTMPVASLVPVLARLQADAGTLGLRVLPTYVSDLDTPGGSATETVYHRLVHAHEVRS